MGKEQQMDMRIVSAGSAGKVYHRPNADMHGRFTEGIGNKCCGRMQKQRDIDHVPVVMGWNFSMDWRETALRTIKICFIWM